MRSRLLVLLLLLPQLVLLGRGVVLCVAPGGHVGLEVAAAPCCAPEAPEAPDESEDDEHSCPRCSHIELTGAAVAPSERQSPAPELAALPLGPGLPLLASARPCPAIVAAPDGAPPPGIAHLRSTVLRL